MLRPWIRPVSTFVHAAACQAPSLRFFCRLAVLSQTLRAAAPERGKLPNVLTVITRSARITEESEVPVIGRGASSSLRSVPPQFWRSVLPNR